MSAAEPTLTEALRARGYEHRPSAHGARDIVRISDGVTVTTVRAAAAWEWVHAFDRMVAKGRKSKHRHDFLDGDVCSTCDAARGAA